MPAGAGAGEGGKSSGGAGGAGPGAAVPGGRDTEGGPAARVASLQQQLGLQRDLAQLLTEALGQQARQPGAADGSLKNQQVNELLARLSAATSSNLVGGEQAQNAELKQRKQRLKRVSEERKRRLMGSLLLCLCIRATLLCRFLKFIRLPLCSYS